MQNESGAKDYKDTVNLPKTEFPMKGNLTQLEPRMLERWATERTYERMIDRNRSNPLFVFHDGPPYANGHFHIGHALNRVLKDMVVKYRNLAGFRCDFVPGWDCHGLPIEQAVEKRLKDKKIDKRTLSRDQFLEECRKYALEFVDVQRGEAKRLGTFADWEHPYLTLTFDYEAQEIRELATIASKGLMYRRKKPVYWCITDQTALAEAEVEYEDHESPSVYVAMRAKDELFARPGMASLKGREVDFAIWTTTPWTLPANLAIAVHPKLEYVAYDLGPRVIIVAKDLLGRVLGEIAPDQLKVKSVELPAGTFDAAVLIDPARVLAYIEGSDLEGLSYQHPFYPRTGKLVLGEHVTLDAGTGLVHTAPGHGQEDYEVGLAYKLDIYNPVKNDGRYDDTVGPELAGKKVFEANPLVVAKLVEVGALLNKAGEKVAHSYPHCWRCHNPIIFRATHQWFIALDGEQHLRKSALDAIDRVNWVPKWGRERIRGMLETRPDWCISRQRQWGVPIPVVICDGCDHAIVSPELMNKVADAVEKSGAGIWYSSAVTDWVPGGKCPSCGKAELRKETDILDVWFDSACSFAAVAAKRDGMRVPVDLYLEGSDQHRGWFHSSLLVATGTRGDAPYKSCLTHGFVVDGEGKKMSKSLGNVIAPEKVIQQYGAEVLRLWVASSDYRDDVRLSDQILKGLSEGYRKIRNTLRYALSNLYDFDPKKDAIAEGQLKGIDAWARVKLAELTQKVLKGYEAYEFHLVYHHVVDFCAMELSAIYFDILKDRLYTHKASGPSRRAAQTVIYEIATTLLRLLAPVTSFTAEEAWQFLPGEKTPSVFLASMPKPAQLDARAVEDYERLLAVRSEVQKHLEAARRDKMIGSSLEAKVVLSTDGAGKGLLERHRAELPGLFIVSQVELAAVPGAKAQKVAGVLEGGFGVEVLPADGAKCPRCWKYSVKVAEGSPVCMDCEEALR
jgi:isoleucyl-tRNA synthetase